MKRKFACTNYFIILGKKRFSREHTNNPNANVRACQKSNFGLWDIIPPESHLAFHIYYVKYKKTFTCKRISWDWGDDVLKTFFYFLYV